MAIDEIFSNLTAAYDVDRPPALSASHSPNLSRLRRVEDEVPSRLWMRTEEWLSKAFSVRHFRVIDGWEVPVAPI